MSVTTSPLGRGIKSEAESVGRSTFSHIKMSSHYIHRWGWANNVPVTLCKSLLFLRSLGLATRPNDNQQKKRSCKIVDFAVLADHRVKLKESEKRDKYLDLARELKNIWNMNVTFTPIVIGALVQCPKG